MQFSTLTLTLALATAILAVPLPQANKIGEGIYDLGTGVDDSTGYDVQNVGGDAENALESSTALTAIGGPNSNPGNHNANNNNKKSKRQANKIGEGIYDLGTGVDDSTGYDVQNVGGDAENALEDSTALTAIGGPNSNPGNHNANNNNKKNKRSPRPQLGNDAGGAAAVFDGIDTGAGQGVQNGLDNGGTLIANEGLAAGNLVPSKKERRQLGNDAGGVAAVFDGIDTGAGQGVENGLDHAGTLIANEGLAAGNLVPSKN